jgi:hypothetical protein
MNSLEAVRDYAAMRQPVFPCRWQEPGRKRPLTTRGFHDATCEPTIITRWWRQWPDALIGMPTGPASGFVVLDIDIKDPAKSGFYTLEDLGHAILPETPMVHTAGGGLHVYFCNPSHRELRCSVNLLGPGLDIRGTGGYVILPSPGSAYTWDPVWNFDTVKAVEAPDWLWPVQPSRPISPEPIRTVSGLSPYAEAAINAACDAIVRASRGQQERTLNAECFSIGTLAGAGGVPADLALRALLRAASRMPDHDPAWPWRPEEIDLKVQRAFNAGMTRPRETKARHALAG